MEYKFPPIPTCYRGILMKSYLEARWAAMFDLMGWRWCYEPVYFDKLTRSVKPYVPSILIDQRLWLPDFALRNPDTGKAVTLVEVKPLRFWRNLKKLSKKYRTQYVNATLNVVFVASYTWGRTTASASATAKLSGINCG